MKMLSLLLVLVCMAHSEAMKLAGKKNDRHYLERVIDMARNSNSTLNETLQQTFVLDITHLTGTVSHCKTFFCQAHDLLTPVLGETHRLVRNLKMYTQHQCSARGVQGKETGSQMRLRKLLEALKVCAQRVLSKAEPEA